MANLSVVFLLALGCQAALGMDCSPGTSGDEVDKFFRSCPRLFGSREKSYCCWSPYEKDAHCCNLTDYVFNSISPMLPLIILGLVVSFIVVSCLCYVYKLQSGVLRREPMIATVGPHAMPPTSPFQPLSGVLRREPMIATVGPHAMPPTSPFQPLSDGRGGWAAA